VVRDVPGRPYVGGLGGAGGAAAPVEAVQGPYLKVAKTYVIRATEDGFEIVDQHALHERVTYEELKRDLRAGALEVQRLLLPEVIELGRDRVKLVEEHLETLAGIGIVLSVFGEGSIAVQGVPARLGHDDCEGLVRDAVEVIASRGRPPEAVELLEDVLHSRACRSSVMAGDDLSQEEIASLLRRASRIESDQTCPHGRPTRVRFTLSDLEKAFHRR
jgi:DNA mismatch repair protein MutL